MRIVTKKELLELPKGTVYRELFEEGGYGSLEIKMSNNFGSISVDPWEVKSGYPIGETWDCSFAIDFHESALFMIYEEQDIEKVIDLLKKASGKQDE